MWFVKEKLVFHESGWVIFLPLYQTCPKERERCLYIFMFLVMESLEVFVQKDCIDVLVKAIICEKRRDGHDLEDIGLVMYLRVFEKGP